MPAAIAHQKRSRTGIWTSSSDDVEKRRARNRQSQRCFRERRELRTQELEAKVRYLEMGEKDRHDALIASNSALRSALIQARQQAQHVKMVMAGLDQTLAAALELPASMMGDKPNDQNAGDLISTCISPQSPPEVLNGNTVATSSNKDADFELPADTDDMAIVPAMTGFPPEFDTGSLGQIEAVDERPTSFECFPESFTVACFPSDDLQAEPQTCLSPLRERSTSSALLPNRPYSLSTLRAGSWDEFGCNADVPHSDADLRASYSRFSDLLLPPNTSMLAPAIPRQIESRIRRQVIDDRVRDSISGCVEAMEQSLKSHIESFMGQANETFLQQASLLLMIYFSRYLWPGPSMLWFSSFTYGMTERSLLWRLSQSQRCLERLPTYMAPTRLQSLIPHYAMLSWVTQPGLRDSMLQYYAPGRPFDTVWLALMAHAVVEVEEISTIVTGVGTGPGYLGIWNIFDQISPKTTADNAHEMNHDFNDPYNELAEIDRLGLLRVYRMNLPQAPEPCHSPATPNGAWDPVPLEQLLSSPILAQRLYYHLELYNSHKCWRIDPQFFEKYPNLRYPGHKEHLARGRNLRRDPGVMRMPSRESISQILYQYQLGLLSMDMSAFL